MNVKRTQRGSAFILALATMVVMVLVVTSFSVRLESHLKSETGRLERRRADNAIQAGIARAMASLTDANLNVLDTNEEWATLGETGSVAFIVGDAQVRLQILDTTRYVNLNTATEQQLEKLNLTAEQTAALLDWREEQLQPRQLGAKDEYYNTLPTPYNTKLRRFESVSEIFLVRGFTPYFVLNPPENTTASLISAGNAADQPSLASLLTTDSQSPNLRADGSERVNLNQAQNAQLVQAGISNQAAQAIVQRRNTQGQFTSFSQVFNVNGINVQDAETLMNVATVTAETFLPGKININTAPEAVIRTIPDITEDQVQGILSRQGTFEEFGELAQVPGFSTNALSQLVDYFTISCQTFLIRLEGRKGTVTSYMEAVVTVTNGQPKLIKMNRPLQRNPLVLWEWEDEAITDQTLMEPTN